jgi:uncharacterized protein (DUF1697 family)
MIVAAFLRGMNLGNRRITNAELKQQFVALGFESVATFRASGNVVFEGPEETEAEITTRIEIGLERGLGYPVPAILRTAGELREVAASEPFGLAAQGASKGKLQVSLLADKPSPAARKKVLALAGDQDLLAFGARELFWLPSAGTIDSDLDLKAIKRELGLATMRTKGTIDQLYDKFMGSE